MDVNKIAERIVAVSPEDDEALNNVDQALDALIAAIIAIEENLPKVKADSVPQRAAIDSAKDALESGVKPYAADLAQAMSFFD